MLWALSIAAGATSMELGQARPNLAWARLNLRKLEFRSSSGRFDLMLGGLDQMRGGLSTGNSINQSAHVMPFRCLRSETTTIMSGGQLYSECS